MMMRATGRRGNNGGASEVRKKWKSIRGGNGGNGGSGGSEGQTRTRSQGPRASSSSSSAGGGWPADRPIPGSGEDNGGLGRNENWRENNHMHPTWRNTNFEDIPVIGDENDPYGPDPEVQRRVKLFINFEKKCAAIRDGIGAEVKEKLRGMNIYVVGSSDDNNGFLAGSLAKALGYTHFTSAELCIKTTGLNRSEVLENDGAAGLHDQEQMLLRSFNQVQKCCIGALGQPSGAAEVSETWPIALDGGMTVWIEDTIGDVEGGDEYKRADVHIKCKPLTGLERFLNTAEQADTALHDISRLIDMDESLVTKKLGHAEANKAVAR